jgi:hypothetical protein
MISTRFGRSGIMTKSPSGCDARMTARSMPNENTGLFGRPTPRHRILVAHFAARMATLYPAAIH